MQNDNKNQCTCAPSFRLAYFSLLLAVSVGSGSASQNYLAAQNYKVVFSTQEQLAEDIALAPCKDSERLTAVKALFMKMGAREEDGIQFKHSKVSLQELTRNMRGLDVELRIAQIFRPDSPAGAP